MNQIKKLRQAHIPKMSQEKLGALVGFERSTIAMWEAGRSEPDNKTLIKLAEIFGVSTDYLLGLTDKKEEPAPEDEGGPSEKDVRLIEWFRSLPPGKRKAILMLGEAPEDLDE